MDSTASLALHRAKVQLVQEWVQASDKARDPAWAQEEVQVAVLEWDQARDLACRAWGLEQDQAWALEEVVE